MVESNPDKSIKKNITLPASFEDRIAYLRQRYGAASTSELIRIALTRLEEAGYQGPRRPASEVTAVRLEEARHK